MNSIDSPTLLQGFPLSVSLSSSTADRYLNMISEIFRKALNPDIGNTENSQKRRLCREIIACHQNVHDPRIKEALLNYLFQYSQFNAPYAEAEALRLGYSLPFYGIQKHPGYVRTQDPYFFELIAPWINSFLLPVLIPYFPCNKINIKNFFLLTDSSASHTINDFENSTDALHCNDPVLFQAYLDYYNEMIASCKNFIKELHAIKHQINNPQVHLPKPFKLGLSNLISDRSQQCDAFVKRERTFFLNFPFFGFSIVWKGKFEENKNKTWNFSSLDNEKKRISLTGRIADRFSIHSFVSHYLTERNLSIECTSNVENALPDLPDFHKKISLFEDRDDLGASLFKRLIIHWLSSCNSEASPSFFNFVRPFLSQIVEKPLNAYTKYPLVQLVNIAQHCSELILLYFSSFPNIRQKYGLDEAIASQLSLSPSCRANVKLLSYGMSAFFEILHTLSSEGKKKKICCVTQDYFEIVSLSEKASQHYECEKCTSLMHVDQIPDVLVVDIHPNNATQENLHENDVLQWMKKKFIDESPEKSMTLILDVTLNHFSDSIIEQLLHFFTPLIETKKLNLFFVQSLAKIMQIGLDNLSGGLLVHIQPCDPLRTEAVREVSAKEAFFSYLISDCSFLAKEYFQLIRKNTHFLYKTLSKQFNEIYERIRFRGMSIATNVDTGAVYIAFRFTEFFQQMLPNADDKKKEGTINGIRNLLYEMAYEGGFPITSRQSLGFPLSNLSGTAESIRFSIGIENQEILQEYLSLFTHFNYALSYLIQYRSQIPGMDVSNLFALIKKSYLTLRGKEEAIFTSIPLRESGYDSDEDAYKQSPSDLKSVSIAFREGEIFILKNETKKDVLASSLQPGLIITQDAIDSKTPLPYLSRLRTYLDLSTIREQFFVEFLDDSQFYITSTSYCSIPLDEFESDSPSLDHFTFLPDFILRFEDKEFEEDKVYFVDPKYGMKPFSLSLINDTQKREQIYNTWIKNHVRILPYEDGVLIEVIKERQTLNYRDKVKAFFKKDGGGIHQMIDFLNSLNIHKLPLPDNPSLWNMNPKQALINELYSFGYSFMDRIFINNKNEKYRSRLENAISSIKESIFRNAITDGLNSFCPDDLYDFIDDDE